jgi:integrase
MRVSADQESRAISARRIAASSPGCSLLNNAEMREGERPALRATSAFVKRPQFRRVQDYRNALIVKQKRSRPLVAKVLTSLVPTLATTQAAGLVARNVVRDRGRAAGARQRRLEKRQDKRLEVGIDIPTKGELWAILRAAESMEQRWRALMITTLVFTGLRASELRGLRWQDVDLGAASISRIEHRKQHPSLSLIRRLLTLADGEITAAAFFE